MINPRQSPFTYMYMKSKTLPLFLRGPRHWGSNYRQNYCCIAWLAFLFFFSRLLIPFSITHADYWAYDINIFNPPITLHARDLWV